MKPEDLESRLSRESPAPLPAGWRAEILTAARAAARPATEIRTASRWWADLWPSPWAWAGVASLWVAILAFYIAAASAEPSGSPRPTMASAQAILLAIAERQRLWQELTGQPIAPPSTPPSAPAPPELPPRSSLISASSVSV